MREEYKTVIKYLYENKTEFISSFDLSNLISVSSKTVNNYLLDISDFIREYGAKIESKTGLGYRIIIDNTDLFNTFLDTILMKPVPIANEMQENIHFITQQFLVKEFVKSDNLSDRLFLNRRSISTLYRKVEGNLEEFNIEMIRKSSQGNSLNSSEHNIRACINYEMYYAHNSKKKNEDFLSAYVNESVTNEIYKVIIDIQSRYSGNYLSHVDIAELSSALFVAHVRNSSKNALVYDDDTIERFNKRNSFYMASDIVRVLIEKFHLHLRQEDIIFTTIFIVSHRNFISKYDFPINEDYQECERLSRDLIEYLQVLNNFKYISKDDLLLESLSLNLTQLITQSEYKLYSAKTINRSSKSLQALLLSVQATEYLMRRFKFKLVESQITYLASIIYPVFGRFPFEESPKNGIVISDINKAVGVGVSERLMRNFSRYIKSIEVLELFDLNNYSLKDVQYIFSSYPKTKFDFLNSQVEYIYVDTFFNLSEKDYIRSKLIKNNKTFSSDYVGPIENAEIVDLNNVKDNKDLLKKISNNLEESKAVKSSSELYNQLNEYNRILSFTEEMNVVFMTPLKSVTDDPLVRLFKLEKGITWNNNRVNLIVFWDRGTTPLTYKHSENEAFSLLIYNTFIDQAIVSSILKENCTSYVPEKVSRLSKIIVGGGASFK